MNDPADREAFERMIRSGQLNAAKARWRDRWRLSEPEKLMVYAVLKWAAYSVWCFVGLGLARRRQTLAGALGLGACRVVMGIGFGYLLFIPFFLIARHVPSTFLAYASLYLLIYMPVRWIEWGLMSRFMRVTENRSA